MGEAERVQELDGRLDPREEGLLVDLIEHCFVLGYAAAGAAGVVAQRLPEPLHRNARDAPAADCASMIPNQVRMGCLGDTFRREDFGEHLVFGGALSLLFGA